MTRQERLERQRTNSATSYHSMSAARFASDPVIPTPSSPGSAGRNPINVPPRPRNGSSNGRFDRDHNISPGSHGAYSQSPPLSSPKASASSNFSDHRRELAVLQNPQFIMRQNPPSASPSPITGHHPLSGTPNLNSNIFDNSQEPFALSPLLRPGTAPSVGPSDSYFPDETRRPSVASVVTNASSNGSKSSMGRSIYKKIFGGDDATGESPGSSESSLPPNVTPRSQHVFTRPVTPTISRPRTPVPSSDVVPFLYQDPADIRRIGDAPVHDIPISDKRYDPEDASASTSSSHTHRGLHLRGRNKNRDKQAEKEKEKEKELPPRPGSGRDSVFGDYRRGLKLHLDGTASSHSSQTRLIRSGSPTPSMASTLSGNPPRSPGGEVNAKTKGFLRNKIDKLIKKDKDKVYESEKNFDGGASSRGPRLRAKASEPALNTFTSSPAAMKRGSGGHNEYITPRLMDYASVEQIKTATKQDGRKEGKKEQVAGRKGGRGKGGQEEETPFRIDTDFSDIDQFVNRAAPAPDPNSSWLDNTETQPHVDNATWEPPESWATQGVAPPSAEASEAEEENESGPEDSQYCIRVFRADSTFATLSCKVQASVTEVLGLLGRKSFLQDNLANYQIVMRKNGLLRILGPNERPLKIQKRLLEQVGYTEEDHLDEIGREDHGYLVRFTFMMARTGSYSLDQDSGLNKVQKFSHVDLQGRNLLTIPITLYHKASEIISLNLSRNLSLNIPKDFIQQCVNLRKIEFTGNEAERLPGSISSASRLTYLDISTNRLEELEHAALEDHIALVALKMSCNRLSSLPQSFGQFKSLRNLHVSSNRLTVFPAFICDLVTLVELDISFNGITSFPLEIGQLSALERLIAANNRLTGSLPPTFSNLGSLKELDLRFNYELQNIDVVSELPRLEAIVVSHNRVSGFQQSFHKLRALHLNSNPVTQFSLTTILPTLKFLNLSNAKIAAINETLFDKLPNLEKLYLDKNHIVSIPPQIAKLRKLEHLSCSRNELATIPKEIGQLSELKYLDLHYNNIKTLPGEIWQMASLITLNLSSNIIKTFPQPVAGPAFGTTFSENTVKEKSIPENPNEAAADALERPETADRRPSQQSGGLLTAANLPAPPNGVKNSPSIYGQSGRKASVISRASSDTMTIAPTVASRKDSSSSGKLANTFVYSLKYLYLADNILGDECFEELSLLGELRVLNLSYNDLYDIPPRALSRMPLLSELYLSGNEMTSLPAEDLEHIPYLKVLHLNGNKFQTLPAELGKIRKLLVLDVGNNALKYNISNWPYDWNWNWNLDLKYLNLSGNKRLEIKPSRGEMGASREKSITDFSQMTKLRVLGLMDVTLMSNTPDQTEDRRVRLSGSMIRSMSYGMADSLGRSEHLSLIDMVVPDFRTSRDEWLVGLFDGQALSTGGSKISKFLHESLEFFFKEELNKLKGDETPATALRRTFLNLNKELASTAMQPLDDKGATRHPSTGGGAMLGPIDLNSGGVATVIYNASNKLYVANVGDATAVLTRTDSSHHVLTKKHDSGNATELERIREAGGWVSRTGKLNDVLDTSRAFGYFHLMPAVNAAPDIQEMPLEGHEEMLILASKELWEYLSVQTAVDIARKEKADLMRAAHKLRDIAIAYGATNKIMVMVLGIGDMKKPKRNPKAHLSVGPGFTDDDFPTIRVTRKRGKETDNSLSRLGDEVRAPDGDLAMVFTDIKNSTVMWENHSVAMRSGIRIHNAVMRRQLRQVGGYEVKTEGDAFMVSFPTATAALLWCFNVQRDLLDQEWPDEILDSENGREIQDSEGRVIYKGLSVRMGIHWGAPVCEPDPITGRMDYFGPMVNRASRISSVADGGEITVSSDFVAEINRCVSCYSAYQQRGEQTTQAAEEIFGDAELARSVIKDLRDLSNKGFQIKELGERKLKGLENPEFVCLMYPAQLAGRLESKSAQKAVSQPKLSVNPEELWKLWELSIRLEMLCSSLTAEIPGHRVHPTDMIAKLREVTPELLTDQIMMPVFEQIVTRIENCMSVLYIRRLLVPESSNPLAKPTSAPLCDLLDHLEARLGVKISGSAAAAAAVAAADAEDSERLALEDICTSSSASTSSSAAVSPTTATRSSNSRKSYIQLNLPTGTEPSGSSLNIPDL